MNMFCVYGHSAAYCLTLPLKIEIDFKTSVF